MFIDGHSTDMAFSHNPERKRFELDVDGDVAFLTYRQEGNALSLNHAEVPQAFEGRGFGSQLVKRTLAYVREHDLTVVPRCSFVRDYLERHPEEQDVVAA